MEQDENHRSANPCDVVFNTYLFNDILIIRVTATILETEEGAELEDIQYEVYDPIAGKSGNEWTSFTEEVKKNMSIEFQYQCEEEALELWEAQK